MNNSVLSAERSAPFIDKLVDRRRQDRSGGQGYILGNPGSGRTPTVMLQIKSILRNSEDDVVVFDTEGQYVELAKQVDGQVIRIDGASGVHINPFEIQAEAEGMNDPLIDKSDFIAAWLEAAVGGRKGLTPAQRSLIDRCVKEIYKPYFKYRDKDTGEYDRDLLPILRDLYRALRDKEEKYPVDARMLSTALVLFMEGSIDMFAYPTNVQHKKRLVVYDISNMMSVIHPAVLLAVLEYTWSCYVKADGRTADKKIWLFVDDLYPILNTDPVQYLRWLQRCGRAWGGILTGVTRHIPTFLEADRRQSLLPICKYIHLFGLAAMERKYFAKLFGLSPEQVSFLENAPACQSMIYLGDTLVEAAEEYTSLKTYRLDNGWVEEPEETICQDQTP